MPALPKHGRRRGAARMQRNSIGAASGTARATTTFKTNPMT
jgi:hypothetical protein